MKITNALAVSASSIAIVTRTASAFSPPTVVVVARPVVAGRGDVVPPLRMSSVDDKAEVREYFNNEGFGRWNKIYSDSDEVNTVQLDIRKGHDMTIQKILNWVRDDGDISGKTVCDCGCGVGSLAIPLAQMGEFRFFVFLFPFVFVPPPPRPRPSRPAPKLRVGRSAGRGGRIRPPSCRFRCAYHSHAPYRRGDVITAYTASLTMHLEPPHPPPSLPFGPWNFTK